MEKLTPNSIAFKREYTNKQNEPMYVWNITFAEKQGTWEYTSKTTPQTKFVVNTPIEAEFSQTQREYQGQQYTDYKVKPVYNQSGGGYGKGGGYKKDEGLIVAQNSMTNATNLACNGKIEIAQLSKYAQTMYDWVMKHSTASTPPAQQANGQTTTNTNVVMDMANTGNPPATQAPPEEIPAPAGEQQGIGEAADDLPF